MKVIKKDMSIQDRYKVIVNNLQEAGLADSEIVELFNVIREDIKIEGNVSITMEERIKRFCSLDKWMAKYNTLIEPCGLKKSILGHIKDYIRETEFENTKVIPNEHQQLASENIQEEINSAQANEEIVYIHLEGDQLLKSVKEFIDLLIKSNSSKGLIYSDKGNFNVHLRKNGKYYRKMVVEFNNQKKVYDYNAKAFLLSRKNLYNCLKEFGF